MNDKTRIQNEAVVVGLDCSTTSTKAVAFDAKGRIDAHAHESIPLRSPQPNQYEQSPGDWWRSARTALLTITRRINPARIAAIAIANQRETFVPLDTDGKMLRPAIVWLDERCKEEVESFSTKIGKSRIHRITGKPPDYAPVVYRLAWMKKHEPTRFRNIAMICDVQTYLVHKLTGTYATSWASADPLGIFDMQEKLWSPPICRALGIRIDQLPRTHRPGSILGTISAEASRSTGMGTHTLIVAGGGDGQAAGLGSNVLRPGRAYLNLGTAVVAGVYSPRYRADEAFRTMCSCSELGYIYECSLRAGTFAVDWLIRHVLRIDPLKEPGIYARLEREAMEIPPGSDGVMHLPYLCGVMNPYWDMNARGAFVGLSSSHGRGHLYRAILEGIAFEQRTAIESIERVIGSTVKEFVVLGGGASNELWCHIIADITGRKVLLPSNIEASALGGAIAAAVGAGWYPTFARAARAMTGTGRTIRPDRQRHREYTELFSRYKTLYPRLHQESTGL